MLTELIPLLEQMTFDEITDFIDYIQYYHQSKFIDTEAAPKFKKAIRSRRSGKPSGGFPDPFGIKDPQVILMMTTPAQREAERMVRTADPEPLETAVLMAQALQRAKAPIRKRSQGNIQVKQIPYQRMRLEPDDEGNLVPALDENGIPIIDTVVGLYLYLRYWQVHGDNNKSKSRVKSIYIGGSAGLRERASETYQYPYRELAYLWVDTLAEYGIERTRRHRDKDTGEVVTITYHVRPKSDDNPIAELEQAILECIDMTTEPPIIDYEALDELQNMLIN